MNEQIGSNKTIAKNTILLYIRQIILLFISLFTSRIVLASLGVVDFGIYNVVGSIVTMFTFLRTAMGNATHRYIAYALGTGDSDKLRTYFSTAKIVHYGIATIIVILCETIGLWFLYNKLVIPDERFTAAFWVFQISIFTCFVSVISVPYDAEIIAHEKFSAFAYISIGISIIKFLMAFVLSVYKYDVLIFYAIYLAAIQLIERYIYIRYCKRKFTECSSRLTIDKSIIKEMSQFAGWNLVGHLSSTVSSQGMNILLNMYFGPVVNAAKGVAQQLDGAISVFTSNFQLAISPQITKNYAANENSRVHELIITSAKLSSFLYILLGIPLFLCVDQILSLWLVEVPAHTGSFVRLLLVYELANVYFFPLNTACLATGETKVFLTVRGLTNLSMLIFSYIGLQFYKEPELVYAVQAFIAFISIFIQFKIVQPHIGIESSFFLKKSVFPTIKVLFLSSIVPFICYYCLDNSLVTLLIIVPLCIIITILSVLFMGFTNEERKDIFRFIKAKIKR